MDQWQVSCSFLKDIFALNGQGSFVDSNGRQGISRIFVVDDQGENAVVSEDDRRREFSHVAVEGEKAEISEIHLKDKIKDDFLRAEYVENSAGERFTASEMPDGGLKFIELTR